MMRDFHLLAAAAASGILLLAGPVSAQQDEGPIATAASPTEASDSLRLREAVAYANPMPRGAPDSDYPLVAWCDALVTGHADLGETLTDRVPEDVELIRLGRLEAQDFRSALTAGEPRASAAAKAEAAEAAAAAKAQWAPLLANEDEATRNRAFGLFFGLPGRCEHAARRVRENITTPPATPAEVGLE